MRGGGIFNQMGDYFNTLEWSHMKGGNQMGY